MRHERSALRRFLAISGAVGLMWCALAGPAFGEDASSASAFVDSIGVNTHSYFGGTAYEDYAWREKLLESGIRHIRENLQRDNGMQVRRINDLYEAGGIRASLIFDPREDRGGTVADLIGQLKGSLLAATDQVEGPNEYENAHRADWESVADDARTYQATLYSTIKSDPATAHLPVLGPSVAFPAGYLAWGDLSGSVDVGNMHSYPGGRKPSANLDRWLAAASTTSGTKPVEASETGYHNAVTSTEGHLPTSERAAAVYVPRTYLEYFRRGVQRTYAYELLNEGDDASKAEKSFGLLRSDYSDKPAMVAVRNLITLLDDRNSWESALTPPSLDSAPATTGSSFVRHSLNYSLLDAPPEVHHVLLWKSDGSRWLALWREVSVWDELGRVDLNRSNAQVTVAFGEPVGTVTTYLPNMDTVPRATWASPSRLTLSVGPMVNLVEITPPSSGSDTDQAPADTPEATPSPSPEPTQTG